MIANYFTNRIVSAKAEFKAGECMWIWELGY